METTRDFPRSIDALDGLFSFLGDQLPGAVAEKAAVYLNLAAEEIFTNMVRHNEPGGERITVAVELDGDRIRVRLTDYDVEPFDPTTAPEVDVTRPMAERQPGGLGLHLVKSIVDRLSYEYRDRTMQVTFIKKLERTDVRDQA